MPPSNRISVLVRCLLSCRCNYHLTFQVVALLLPKSGADFLYPACQRDLDVVSHCLVTLAYSALSFCIFDHGLDPLDGFLAIMKPASDFLRKAFDPVLLFPLNILIFEARQDMFLVQAVKVHGFGGYCTQYLCHLVLYIGPPRR